MRDQIAYGSSLPGLGRRESFQCFGHGPKARKPMNRFSLYTILGPKWFIADDVDEYRNFYG